MFYCMAVLFVKVSYPQALATADQLHLKKMGPTAKTEWWILYKPSVTDCNAF